MNEFILKIASPIILGLVNDLLRPENLQRYGDKLFDFLEDAVKSSKTTVDDMLVLPLIEQLRMSLNIPDQIDEA